MTDRALRMVGAGLAVIVRYEGLRLAAALRTARDYPVTSPVALLLLLGAGAAVRLRLESGHPLIDHPDLAGLALGAVAGAVTSGWSGAWAAQLLEGPLGHLAACRRTLSTAVAVRIAALCCAAGVLALLLIPLGTADAVQAGLGYVPGAAAGCGAAWAGRRLLRLGRRPGRWNPPVRGRNRERPGWQAMLAVHLRRPGRSWTAAACVLLLTGLGVLAGRIEPRPGTDLGHVIWLAALAAGGLVLVAPHAGLLRLLAVRPVSLGILYVHVMGPRIGLQALLALLSASAVFSGPLEAAAWAAAATAAPAAAGTVQFLYGLMFDRTVADFRTSVDVAIGALLAAFVGPAAVLAPGPWLVYLWRRADRMRWGRV